MDLYEAMKSLRAVRRLRPDPIAHDILERVFTAATWAPTGGNMQPWRIVAVTDPDRKAAMEALYRFIRRFRTCCWRRATKVSVACSPPSCAWKKRR
ncbi:MAG: nitroreductase family protein [Proteobacteria bacterium]|nr:nitroreductase family protein [Pseudomonadota bacterium]